MSITIKLNGFAAADQPIFHPGQCIQGTVVYEISKQRPIKKATLSFTGAIKTEYIPLQQGSLALTQGPRRPIREKIVLLDQELSLFEGPYDISPRVFEWPFEFTIPTRFSYTQDLKLTRDGPNILPIEQTDINLPPSYYWRDQMVGRDATAEIIYKLKVHVTKGGRMMGFFKDDDKQQIVTIAKPPLLSPGPSADLKPTPFNFPAINWSSDRLRPEGRRLSVTQRLKSTFSNDPELKTPTLSFRSFIHVPRSLTNTSAPFEVLFSVIHEQKAETDPPNPTLRLTSLTFQLKTHTTMRIVKTGIFTPEGRFCQGEKPIREHTVELQGDAAEKELPLNGDTVIVAENLCVENWKSICPDDGASMLGGFETWFVKLSYRLNVLAVVRHEESDKEFRLQTQFPITLNDTVDDMSPQEESSVEMQGIEDSELPGYSDDVRPPEALGKA